MKNPTITSLCWTVALGLVLLATPQAWAQRSSGGYSGSRSGNSRFGGYGGGYSGGYGGGYGRSSSGAAGVNGDGSRMLGTAVIQYDPDTGSIIVIADEETNERVKQVIESLDRPVPQVLIKVLFLEVTHSNDLDLGAEWKWKGDHDGGTQELSTFFGLARETRGGFYRVIDSDLEATLRAIAETNKLEVLSRPSVLTRNNTEAVITVGQEIPFITNSRVTQDGQTINTIQYSDIGIILRVIPHIAPDGMVEMMVWPEISTLTAETVPVSDTVNARVIAKRSAETRVLVADGKTVVIGGLMENNVADQVTKVPLLGDIPFVGALFRRTIKSKAKTELLIFLTPLVVDNPDTLHELSNAERSNTTLSNEVFTPEQLRQYLETTGKPEAKAPNADPAKPIAGEVETLPPPARPAHPVVAK